MQSVYANSSAINRDNFNNFVVLTPTLALAGKPNEAAIKELKQQGFKLLIDHRTPQEGTQEIARLAKRYHISYVNIPIQGTAISIKQIKQVANIIALSNQVPTLLFCSSGSRATAIWALAEIQSGKNKAKTIEQAKQLLIRPSYLKQLQQTHPLLKDSQ